MYIALIVPKYNKVAASHIRHISKVRKVQSLHSCALVKSLMRMKETHIQFCFCPAGVGPALPSTQPSVSISGTKSTVSSFSQGKPQCALARRAVSPQPCSAAAKLKTTPGRGTEQTPTTQPGHFSRWDSPREAKAEYSKKRVLSSEKKHHFGEGGNIDPGPQQSL